MIFYLIIISFIAGVIGNSLQFVIFSRKKFSKFSSRNLYRVLAVQDNCFIIYNIFYESANYFKIDYNQFSIIWCKIDNFIAFSFCPISGWIIALISIDKYISICYSRKEIFRNRKFQVFILSMVYLFNIFYSIPMTVFTEFITQNKSSNLSSETKCFVPTFLWIMNLLNLALFPFALMLTFSMLLIATIFKTRLKLLSFTSSNDRKRLIKDLKFSLSSIMLNLAYIFLTLPFNIGYITEFNDNIILYYIYYMSYCVNFLILISSNSIFRKEVFILIRIKNERLVYTQNTGKSFL